MRWSSYTFLDDGSVILVQHVWKSLRGEGECRTSIRPLVMVQQKLFVERGLYLLSTILGILMFKEAEDLLASRRCLQE